MGRLKPCRTPATKAYPSPNPPANRCLPGSFKNRQGSLVPFCSIIDCPSRFGQDSRRVGPRKENHSPCRFQRGCNRLRPETTTTTFFLGGLYCCHREQGTLERQWLRTVRIDQPAFASSPSGKYLKSFEKNRRIWRTRVVSLPSTLAFIDSLLFLSRGRPIEDEEEESIPGPQDAPEPKLQTSTRRTQSDTGPHFLAPGVSSKGRLSECCWGAIRRRHASQTFLQQRKPRLFRSHTTLTLAPKPLGKRFERLLVALAELSADWRTNHASIHPISSCPRWTPSTPPAPGNWLRSSAISRYGIRSRSSLRRHHRARPSNKASCCRR